ncbi:putative 39S ribosomal protein L24, mitochondrial [Apostichopus japonicus]|uniref:Large ribosomal subunit protein uL24m n=1 Tax=Stichopus japonicus TaxID=307972 RepID=A0A2G8L6E1_STIJA|nr:putative 39S ribosomal protein L24, mitochondrial [Apostichopus japonicus]
MAAKGSGRRPSWQRVNRFYRFVMSRPWTIQAQIANLPGKERKKVFVEPVKEWKLMKGDLVEILKGKDKGKTGTIIDIIMERNWVIVEGLNCHYRRIGKMEGFKGTYVASEAPLLHRDVALIDPSDNQQTGVEIRYNEAGDEVRVSTRTGRIIPTPQMTTKENDHSNYIGM